MVASPKNLLPNVFYAAKVEYYAARKACPKRNRALPYHVVDRTTPLKAQSYISHPLSHSSPFECQAQSQHSAIAPKCTLRAWLFSSKKQGPFTPNVNFFLRISHQNVTHFSLPYTCRITHPHCLLQFHRTNNNISKRVQMNSLITLLSLPHSYCVLVQPENIFLCTLLSNTHHPTFLPQPTLHIKFNNRPNYISVCLNLMSLDRKRVR